MLDLVVSGPTFYQNRVQNLHIGVEGEKIFSLTKTAPKSEQAIATKSLILPGLIDPHAHFREPGATHKEDFHTGTSAAAAGGVTTALDMPNNKPPTTTKKLLKEKDKIASKKAVIDYGLYLQAQDPSQSDYPLIKYFLADTDFDICGECYSKSTGVNVFHAEDPTLFNEIPDQEIYGLDIFDHNSIRPPAAAEAGCKFVNSLFSKYQKPAHITHVSTRQELHTISEGITKGATPHHLFLSTKNLEALGNYAKVVPPLREEADRIYLLTNLNKISCIGTDHAPHTIEEKECEYPEAKSGVPGIQDYLSLLLTELHKGNLDLSTIVRLTHTSPAEIFNLKKGIKVGNDADLVIVDHKKERTISNGEQLTKCGWSPYDGWSVRGEVQKTIVRGKTIYEQDIGIEIRKWGKNLFLGPR